MKKVRINIDPQHFEKLSPVGAQKAVARRLTRAEAEGIRRLNICLVAAAIFMVVLSILFTSVFADTKEDAQAHECPTPATVVIWQGGMGPWDISPEDIDLVTTVVMSVARGECELAQQAVAQAIRNTCEDFDMTVSDVIQEFGWPTNCTDPATDEVYNAVKDVVAGYAAVNDSLHFAYNPEVQDAGWFEAETQFICQIGNLRFCKAK